MRQPPARILFIEDEPAIRDSVTTALAGAGYLVHSRADGLRLGELAGSFRPDLAILDIALPGPDGLSLARRLRAGDDLPILFLTARDGLDDRLAGFAAGADDYLVKPFALTELLARVHALLRRAGRLHSVTTQAGDLVLDEAARAAWRAGQPLQLTPSEFQLLAYLLARRGRAVISQVWVAQINGRHARPLTAPRLEAFGPNWSPGGRRIGFSSNNNRPQSSLYVMRADGTGVTRLATTKWPTNNFGSSYSPGGGQIAFSSDRRHPDLCCVELFVMRANGSQQHLVPTGLHGVIDVDWGTAPPVPAGSPGTLSRPPAGAPASGASRYAGCHKAPAGLTGNMPFAMAPSGHPRIDGKSHDSPHATPCP